MARFLIEVAIRAQGKEASAAFSQLGRDASSAQPHVASLQASVKGLYSGIATLASFLASSQFLRKAIEEARQGREAFAQLEAGVRSTGGAAGLSAEELKRYADSLKRVSTFTDDAIMQGEAILLTFTRIGRETFPRATQAAIDMATRMGTDLSSAMVQVGKALNDPIQGVSALRRVGVQLSDQQKDQIAQFLKVNDVAAAQAVILRELETEFGGSAKAAHDATGGAKDLSDAYDDLAESIGNRLTPALEFWAGKLREALDDNWLGAFESAVDRALANVVRSVGQYTVAISGTLLGVQSAIVSKMQGMPKLLRLLFGFNDVSLDWVSSQLKDATSEVAEFGTVAESLAAAFEDKAAAALTEYDGAVTKAATGTRAAVPPLQELGEKAKKTREEISSLSTELGAFADLRGPGTQGDIIKPLKLDPEDLTRISDGLQGVLANASEIDPELQKAIEDAQRLGAVAQDRVEGAFDSIAGAMLQIDDLLRSSADGADKWYGALRIIYETYRQIQQAAEAARAAQAAQAAAGGAGGAAGGGGGGGGGFNLGGLGGAAGGFSSFMSVVGIYYAVYKIVKNYSDAYNLARERAELTITAFHGQVLAGAARSKHFGDALVAGMHDLADAFEAMTSSTGFTAQLNQLDVHVKQTKKGFQVIVAGHISQWMKSAQEAFDYAVVQGIKQAAFSGGLVGISEEVRAAIVHSRATTAQGLQSDIDFGSWVRDLGLSDAGRNFREQVDTFQEAVRRAMDLELPPEAIERIGTAYQRMVTDTADSLIATIRELSGSGLDQWSAMVNEHAQRVRDAIAAARDYNMVLLQQRAANAQNAIDIQRQIAELQRRIALYNSSHGGKDLFDRTMPTDGNGWDPRTRPADSEGGVSGRGGSGRNAGSYFDPAEADDELRRLQEALRALGLAADATAIDIDQSIADMIEGSRRLFDDGLRQYMQMGMTELARFLDDGQRDFSDARQAAHDLYDQNVAIANDMTDPALRAQALANALDILNEQLGEVTQAEQQYRDELQRRGKAEMADVMEWIAQHMTKGREQEQLLADAAKLRFQLELANARLQIQTLLQAGVVTQEWADRMNGLINGFSRGGTAPGSKDPAHPLTPTGVGHDDGSYTPPADPVESMRETKSGMADIFDFIAEHMKKGKEREDFLRQAAQLRFQLELANARLQIQTLLAAGAVTQDWADNMNNLINGFARGGKKPTHDTTKDPTGVGQDDGTYDPPKTGGGGGNRQDSRANLLRELGEAANPLDGVAASLAELHKKTADWTAEAKKLGISMDLVTKATKAQLELIKKQVFASVRDFMVKTDVQGQIEAVKDRARQLREDLAALAKEGINTAGRLREVTAAERERIAALANEAYLGMLDGLNKYIGDEALALKLARLRAQMEIQNYQLQLNYLASIGALTQAQIDEVQGAINAAKAIINDPNWNPNPSTPTEYAPGDGAGDGGTTDPHEGYVWNGLRWVPAGSDGSGGGTTDDALQRARDLLKRYQDDGVDEFTRQVRQIEEDFAFLRQQLGDTAEVQQAYAAAIQRAIDGLLEPIRRLQRDLQYSEQSPFDPLEQKARLEAELSAFMARFRSGDLTAISEIPQNIQQLLQVAQEVLPTGSQAYRDLFIRLNQLLNEVASVGSTPQAQPVSISGTLPQLTTISTAITDGNSELLREVRRGSDASVRTADATEDMASQLRYGLRIVGGIS